MPQMEIIMDEFKLVFSRVNNNTGEIYKEKGKNGRRLPNDITVSKVVKRPCRGFLPRL